MTINDKALVTLEKKQLSPVELQVEKLEITSSAKMTEAVELLSQANLFLDAVVTHKEKKTKPLNQALKEIRAETKPLETRLETLIASLRRKMSVYQTEQTRIAQEKEEKIARRVGDGKGKLKTETAQSQIDELDRPDKTVSTTVGSVQFRTVKKFEIMDITMVPQEFLLPNEPAIRAAMKEGRELPGVRYFEDQEPVNSR